MLRFSTKEEAEKSKKLNGTNVEEHRIRVDMAENKGFEKEQILLSFRFFKLNIFPFSYINMKCFEKSKKKMTKS